ncbi:sodium:alanine symporter [Piscirickettsia salmonis]|uniref:Amino-acid carrier protein AlsT n=1 Tax=Piscirickettsia salmonis TaxID=1238 RepID=A0A9Q5YIY4_PISSA|nr:sodium:alanine symporter family protein [Piscirickettsia salmonis]ALA25042.1 amino acid carrier family protein [Piscirickettsia salmonis]APS45328.1 sodium:alanine symporter [Piscirickettsia salmonis]APS48688.1 sodium:alanine symporter [Piscirickettsia salmonis]APS49933.1 sodium:alanine symporter [Piscirickettsia salmonis]APS53124.1 sodium:alanine symporter [Piscirickettsia salmonis]
MEIASFLNALSGFVWGPVMLILLLGCGLYLTIRLRLLQLRKLGVALKLIVKKDSKQAKGEISGFKALTTAMAATVGTGNIAGVATAIVLGGPGAVFWMWMTALIGMVTKYAEAVLAVKYRETDANGNFVGGPMYYIKNGLGSRWRGLGVAFAIFGTIAAFGIGNSVQSNSMAHVLNNHFGISPWLVGGVSAVLVGLVLFGGIRWIGRVTSYLVPIMAVFYIIGGLVVIGLNIHHLSSVFMLIINSAFSGAAAAGGFAGATIMAAIRFGVARGVFSNEAGLGTAPIAHAAAKTNSPVRQGLIAMTGTFFDTMILCSITAFVILLSGLWTSGETGAALSSDAFQVAFNGGGLVVTVGLVIFAFTTLLGWSYYGERCASYLFGTKIIIPYRILWVIVIVLGAVANLNLLWLVADILNALMAIPNLIALILLAPIVVKLTRDYEGS